MSQSCQTLTNDNRSDVLGIKQAIFQLFAYCREQDWSGWDPYDGLNSPIFAKIPLLQNRFCRLAFIQASKRSPVNLRRIFAVPRQLNPKGLALFVSAHVRLADLGLIPEKDVRELADRLVAARSPGCEHYCWGYNFDWQTRYYLVPRLTPNIICTFFAGNALLDTYKLCNDTAYLEQARSAGHFLVDRLCRRVSSDEVCFSYTPVCDTQVHNANLLGAAFLARLSRYTGHGDFATLATAAARFSARRVRPDGSWPYGEHPTQQWVDSFHTGYNLCALETIREALGLEELRECISKGYKYFLDHFLNDDGSVKYYHNRTYPIDATSVAQAIITLCTLRALDPRSIGFARRICAWAFQNLRSPDGWFYYQKWRLWTNRINYMRWSQAWMLLALVALLETELKLAANQMGSSAKVQVSKDTNPAGNRAEK